MPLESQHRDLFLSLGVAVATLLVSTPSSPLVAREVRLRAKVDESNVVRPMAFRPPVFGTGSPGVGISLLTVDTESARFSFSISVDGIDPADLDNSVEANNTALHVHRGTPDVRGPILIDVHEYAREVLPDSNGVTVTDTGFRVDIEGEITRLQGALDTGFAVEQIVDWIASGEAFVAVHTTQNDLTRTGAVRGNYEIIPDVLRFTTSVDESQVVRPAMFQPPVFGTGSPGTGSSMLAVDTRTGEFTFDLEIEGIDAADLDNSIEANSTALHVHNGDSDRRGPILIDVHYFARQALPESNGVTVTDRGFRVRSTGLVTRVQGALSTMFSPQEAIGVLLDGTVFVAVHTTQNDLTRTGAVRGNYSRVPANVFVRGNCDSEGGVTLTDAVVLLSFLFRRGVEPRCLAACDSESTGRLTVSSAVRLLQHVFAGGVPPAAPYPGCGAGNPADLDLGCAHMPSSCRSED